MSTGSKQLLMAATLCATFASGTVSADEIRLVATPSPPVSPANGSTLDQWWDELDAAQAQKDWAKVLELLKTRQQEFARNPDYWADRGGAELRLRNFKGAESAYQAAVSLPGGGTNFAYWGNLGHSQFMVGHIKESIVSYTRTLQIDSQSALIWNNLCWSYVQLALYEEAIPRCRESLRLDPDYAEAWNSIGHAHFGLKEYGAAIQAHEKAVRGHIGNPDVTRAALYYDLGETYARANRLDRVEEIYAQLVRLDPGRADRFRQEFMLTR